MKEKPRIAYILQMFGLGGMPKWIYNLALNLGHEYEFYFIATHSKVFAPEFREVARVKALPFNKWVLAAYLRWHRIDLVQTANKRRYADAALLARVPVVIERTDGLRQGAALSSKKGLDAVIASTRGTIPALSKLINPSKIHLIYNGVDIEGLNAAVPQRFGFAPRDVIIGRTSRLARGKNISLLIRAVIQLRQDPACGHVRLVICGGDNTQTGAEPMLEELKKEAAPLGGSVVFTGQVFDPAGINAGYDIATCTSWPDNEGIPNSLLEAMAVGKPVVATRVGDIPELVQDGREGLLVENEDLEGLVKALRVLVENSGLREKIGKQGRTRVENDFEIKVQVEKYTQLYRRLLDGTCPGPHDSQVGIDFK